MSTTLTQSAPSTTDRATELLAEARSRLIGRDYFDAGPADQQKHRVLAEARGLAIFRSPIGIAAATVSRAMADLHDAITGFLKAYPDSKATHAATATAIEAAGLHTAEPAMGWGYSNCHFDHMPENLRGWLFQVQLMCDLETSLDPPVGMEETK